MLAKLDYVRRSKERETEVSPQHEVLTNQFVGPIEHIFKNLPKPLKWISFFRHDLPLLTDICVEVQEISIQHQLNKSQIRALAQLKETSEEAFQQLVAPSSGSSDSETGEPAAIALRERSAREIEALAEQAAPHNLSSLSERSEIEKIYKKDVSVILMTQLGIPLPDSIDTCDKNPDNTVAIFYKRHA